MKVLLISPLDPKTPTNLKFLVGGENTYTRNLLKNPPMGVKYTHYQTALKTGQISYTKLHHVLRLLAKLRLLPPDAGIRCLQLHDHFDVIHCHVYGLKLDHYLGRVVLSDSSSNYLFLRDYLNWPPLLIKLALTFKKILVKTLDIYDPNFNQKNARLVVWSTFAKSIHQRLQPHAHITVIPPGLEKLTAPSQKSSRNHFNIVFIGIWFKRKGGPLLLEAYKKLKPKYPHLKLTIIGQVPKKYPIPQEVYHRDYLPRSEIIQKILPLADVLILVPPVAEGFGVVVLEAASLRVPAIVTSVWALSEIVQNNQTGFVIKPNDLSGLIACLEKMIINPSLKKRLGLQARTRFLKHFLDQITNRQLRHVYERTISTQQTGN